MRKRIYRARKRNLRVRYAELEETDFDEREIVLGGPTEEPKEGKN